MVSFDDGEATSEIVVDILWSPGVDVTGEGSPKKDVILGSGL